MSFAANVLSHRHFRRRHLFALVLLITVVLWSLLWAFAALHFNKAVDRWTEASQKNGSVIQFSDRYIDGTPWTIHVHLDAFSASHQGSHALRADEAIFYLSVLDWDLVSAKLKGNIQGEIKGTPFQADTFKFGLMHPKNPPINDTETGLFLWVQSEGITPKIQGPFALGEKIDEIVFDIRVMGNPPDFSKTEEVKAWNEASGVIEFDHLGMSWGPMNLSAKGTVAFTAELQPEGAFSGRIEGLDETIDRFIAQGNMSAKQEALLKSSLNVLVRPAGLMGDTAPIVPISIQNGGLFIGAVRLATMPTLVWP